jgi:hypothetical protein
MKLWPILAALAGLAASGGARAAVTLSAIHTAALPRRYDARLEMHQAILPGSESAAEGAARPLVVRNRGRAPANFMAEGEGPTMLPAPPPVGSSNRDSERDDEKRKEQKKGSGWGWLADSMNKGSGKKTAALDLSEKRDRLALGEKKTADKDSTDQAEPSDRSAPSDSADQSAGRGLSSSAGDPRMALPGDAARSPRAAPTEQPGNRMTSLGIAIRQFRGAADEANKNLAPRRDDPASIGAVPGAPAASAPGGAPADVARGPAAGASPTWAGLLASPGGEAAGPAAPPVGPSGAESTAPSLPAWISARSPANSFDGAGIFRLDNRPLDAVPAWSPGASPPGRFDPSPGADWHSEPAAGTPSLPPALAPADRGDTGRAVEPARPRTLPF